MDQLPPTLAEQADPAPADEEPRYCPECGSRVADQASTCLMCGADLTVKEEKEPVVKEPEPRPFKIPWGSLFVGLFTVAAFIGLIFLWVREQTVAEPATPTPSLTATPTRKPTVTPTPTLTPSPTLTPTPIPPIAHQVQQGETLVGIAAQYPGVSVEAIQRLNDLTSDTIVAGEVILIPGATPTPGPTPTLDPNQPAPTMACPRIHTVQAGDTLESIARAYDVSVEIVQLANQIDDPESLQIDQALQIPCPTPVPTPTPTIDPNATPTPVPKYPAPLLLSPPDDALITEAIVPLQWSTVSLLGEKEWYVVRLRRLDADHDLVREATKTTLWRLEQPFGPPPDKGVYEFSWEVIVVRHSGTRPSGEPSYAAASYLSERRSFRWLPPTPTPGPSPTPQQ